MRVTFPRTRLSSVLFVAALVGIGCGDEPGASTQAKDDSYGVAQLRLLTRRDYDASVADLLFAEGGESPTECQAASDCTLTKESCVGGVCVADPCNLVTFTLAAAPGDHTSVVVAGSFNAWDAATGYAMTYDAKASAWVVKHEIPNGSLQYKFVIDGSTWLADPGNPSTVSDGFGGVNSVLDLACSGDAVGAGTATQSFSQDFPVETRPEHFPFDDAASSGLVTDVHAEQYFRAAKRIAELATTDLERLVGCSPASSSDPCLEDFVVRFGRRAYRRPLASDELDRLTKLMASAPDARRAALLALRVMLSSPAFLYRSEVGEEVSEGVRRLTDYEVASALSYTFWGTTPDDTLLDAAESGELADDAGIAAQAERLLDDPRAEGTMGTFAAQWLGVESVVGIDKGARPDFDLELSQEMDDETRRFVAGVIQGGKLGDLFTADHTLAAPRLRALYGADANGLLPPERRAGVLTQGAVLASYAHSDQTSPVRRGLFVRRRLMCMELGTPPANAAMIPDIAPGLTTRQRFEQHSKDPACYSCHQNIDPVGFGFEHFDPIGAWRTEDTGQPVDASGVLTYVNGWADIHSSVDFASLPELGAALASSDQVKRCFATQVLRFTSGRILDDADPAVEPLVEMLKAAGDAPRAVLVGATAVKSFRLRKVQP